MIFSVYKADDLVDVCFSADLKRHNDEFAAAGTYQVFIACGAFVAGVVIYTFCGMHFNA